MINKQSLLSLKAGSHLRQSHSQSHTIQWKSNQRSQKQNTDSAYDSVAYDLVKTALSESEAEAEKQTNHNARFQARKSSNFGAKDNMAEEEQLVLWLSLIIILHRQRQYNRNNIIRKRKRFWVRDIYRRWAALEEYANLISKLQLSDREFYFWFRVFKLLIVLF